MFDLPIFNPLELPLDFSLLISLANQLLNTLVDLAFGFYNFFFGSITIGDTTISYVGGWLCSSFFLISLLWKVIKGVLIS